MTASTIYTMPNTISTSSMTVSSITATNPVHDISCSGTISTNTLFIQGKSITDRLDAIEKRLMILQENTALEAEWNELRELNDKYKLLEEKIIEKQKIYAILKK